MKHLLVLLVGVFATNIPTVAAEGGGAKMESASFLEAETRCPVPMD
jgi:hypothetical protein